MVPPEYPVELPCRIGSGANHGPHSLIFCHRHVTGFEVQRNENVR